MSCPTPTHTIVSTPEARSCLRCHKLHKKCDLSKPSCARCFKARVDCDYTSEYVKRIRRPRKQTAALRPTPSISPPANEVKPILNPGVPSRDHVYNIPTPLIVEDPDLLPTVRDWTIIHGYLSFRGALLALLDSRKFLDSFFVEPPELRLSVCALAAYMQIPVIKDHVSFAYFEKSKKAFNYSRTGPSVKKLQALVIQSSFSVLAYGNPNAAKLVFESAVRMMFQLRLHIDPDQSPWLVSLNLSDEEKNERRILFWVVFYMIRVIQIIKDSRVPSPNINAVQSAKQIISGGPPISIRPVATVCFICHMLDIVFEATLEHKNIPESTFHILNSTKTTYLQHRIDELKAKIPFDLLLLIQDGTLPLFLSLSPTQLETMRVMDVLMVSMLFNSTICIIYRTCLYLTSFLTLTSPQLLVPENLTKLLMVLETCVTSARTITALNTWILNLPATTDVTPGVTGYKLRHNVFMEQSFTYFALFEAAVVLWFVTTKTQTFWWRNTIGGSGEVLSMTLEDRRIIRSEVLDLLHTLRDLEELHSMKRKVGDEVVPNMITPLVRCVAGMVDEMEQIENSSPTTRKPLDAYDDDDSLDFVVLGMKAMMIDGSPNVDERMDVPWVFLGLLGVDVGKMRWNGALESQWRSFWKRSVAQ